MTNQHSTAPAGPTFELFEPLLGQVFEVPFADEVFAFTLAEAKSIGNFLPQVHSRPPFTLVFHCPDVRILPQALYPVKHEQLGLQEIFLVPIAGNAEGVSYEAVFN